MASYLIDRNSPIRSGIAPKLRHRSPNSESDHHVTEGISSFNTKLDGPFSPEKNKSQENISLGAQGFNHRPKEKGKSLLGYFMTELTRDYRLEGDASEFVERRDRVYTSVNTPKNLEKFCAFGFLQCLDSILYMVTFLPLRIIVAIAKVLTYPCAVVFTGDRRFLDGAQICDLLKGLILVISCFITSYIDMSMIYHIVRGQSIIKFYVFYNMLDVMDKLVSGFGQDVLDSLYWTAVEPRGRKREHFGTIFHLIFAITYVVVHTVMILIQAIILNVAFNSHNKNLLTIMMSNNFVEIKGNLFKRLDKNNLCQITYSDVKERFHYLVLLLFVFIRNMKELQWSWDMAFPIIQDAAIVMFVEIIVDWIKHAFITKFNELSASSYADFALGLAQDIATSQKKHAFTNFSDQVCRRMGFTPMPLICLLYMVCTTSFSVNGPLPWLLVFLFYLCLISTKVLNSIILLGWAQRLINERNKSAKSTGTVVNSQVIPKKEEKGPSKVKAESDLSTPVASGPRLTTVSSSVAVNTDASMYTDASDTLSDSVYHSTSYLSTSDMLSQSVDATDILSESVDGIYPSASSNPQPVVDTRPPANVFGHTTSPPPVSVSSDIYTEKSHPVKPECLKVEPTEGERLDPGQGSKFTQSKTDSAAEVVFLSSPNQPSKDKQQTTAIETLGCDTSHTTDTSDRSHTTDTNVNLLSSNNESTSHQDKTALTPLNSQESNTDSVKQPGV
ncbi:transmembrane anterior posterior transformation protein 1 homolog [Physella acuta]|uniref:transmembrane anterior posterior transformation protein 1 homolog n=1 Tax=Physella acuta TaxID=109671 RepID=UPI0027DBA182|nr:transmembrane anterior posterior transformation protein 1 homolog [Physella acuta]XP_059172575.1 transmembrane anterior posterior transformation protein 1 homolog [Physella acuta]XP_059172584.1 transmembrane anterior posterior transformation protein 1 homolog [Physella acuta]XP_059172593.1 transmembrane anterior posterior transformation protein 1 homolog [Physella acuta]XP_059172600.1 transmembrane anterior posterior transformation protein 1 homolog [Physella acuta]